MLTIAASGVLVLLHNDTGENMVRATKPPGRKSQYTKSNSHAGLLQYKEFQSYLERFNKNMPPDVEKMTMPTILTLSD